MERKEEGGAHLPPSSKELLNAYSPGFRRAMQVALAFQASILTINRIIPPSVIQVKHRFQNVLNVIHLMFILLISVYYYIFLDTAIRKTQEVHSRNDIKEFRSIWEVHAANKTILSIAKKRSGIKVEKLITTDQLPGVDLYIFANTELSKCQPNKVVLQIHGGGFVAGSPIEYFGFCAYIAKKLHDVVVVSVNYRKGPEFKYPRGFLDCYNTYTWLKQNFVTQILKQQTTTSSTTTTSDDDVKIALIGDSAGGNLVTAVTLKLIDNNLPLPVGVVAIYPAIPIPAEEKSKWPHMFISRNRFSE